MIVIDKNEMNTAETTVTTNIASKVVNTAINSGVGNSCNIGGEESPHSGNVERADKASKEAVGENGDSDEEGM